MSRPWSKLQSEIYNLILKDELNLQIHTTAYPVRTGRKGKGNKEGMPRYFITLNKENVWDWPRDFDVAYMNLYGSAKNSETGAVEKYSKGGCVISGLIEEYIHSSKEELKSKIFPVDKWGFTEILKASDRRFGKKTLETFKTTFQSQVALRIIELRLK